MKTSEPPVIVEETFNIPKEKLWSAITELDEMHKWYFVNIPDFKPEIGFKTQFNIQSNDRNFLHKWKVTEVETQRMIKYVWEFEEYSGKLSTAFELIKQGNLTKLILTVEVQESFLEGITEFTRENCIAGWEYFINYRLKDFLNSN